MTVDRVFPRMIMVNDRHLDTGTYSGSSGLFSMANGTEDTDPLADALRGVRDDRRPLSVEHANLRASADDQSAIRQIDRYILDYGLGINAIDFMAARNPPYFNERISLRMKPHFVQSMIAAGHMIKEGLHDPARREMRFLVEAATKALWLDQGPAV